MKKMAVAVDFEGVGAETEDLDELERELLDLCNVDVEDVSVKKRDFCKRCRRPASVCLCSALPTDPVPISSTVVVLQHPNEEKRSLTTVPILQACLPQGKCWVIKGRRFSPYKHEILRKSFKSERTFLLYPSSDAVSLDSIPTEGSQCSEPATIIAIDGTWAQARSLLSGNEFLQKLKKVKINTVPRSEYVVRTQPTKESLCTLESVTYALMHFESNPALSEVLLQPLRMLCQFQLNHGSAVQYSKDDERYIHRTERKKMMKEEAEDEEEAEEGV